MQKINMFFFSSDKIYLKVNQIKFELALKKTKNKFYLQNIKKRKPN